MAVSASAPRNKLELSSACCGLWPGHARAALDRVESAGQAGATYAFRPEFGRGAPQPVSNLRCNERFLLYAYSLPLLLLARTFCSLCFLRSSSSRKLRCLLYEPKRRPCCSATCLRSL